jgi:hypothetical protein
MEKTTKRVTLAAGGKSSSGIVHLRIFTPAEQQKRAWKALFLFLGLGIVSIILPLAHFFLVPGFLFASPFAYRWAKRQEGLLESIEGHCPFCTKPLAHLGGALQWPIRFNCVSCGEPVRAVASHSATV